MTPIAFVNVSAPPDSSSLPVAAVDDEPWGHQASHESNSTHLPFPWNTSTVAPHTKLQPPPLALILALVPTLEFRRFD